MKLYIWLILLSITYPFMGHTQTTNKQNTVKKWQFQYNGGIYFDFGGEIIEKKNYEPYQYRPASYWDNLGKRLLIGYIDRYELKRYLPKNKSAVSLYFSYARWRDIYGDYYDPQELFKGVTRTLFGYQFAANYYKVTTIQKKHEIHWGGGLLLNGSKNDFFYYRDTVFTNGRLEAIESSKKIHWNPGLAITGNYMFNVNSSLQIGAMLNLNIVKARTESSSAIMGCIGIKF